MSTILRTWRNLRKIGIKEYAHQMLYIGDTKAGTYIASDRYGNKYYENLEDELPRTLPPSPNQSRGNMIWDATNRAQKWAMADKSGSTDPMGRLQGKRIRSVRRPLLPFARIAYGAREGRS